MEHPLKTEFWPFQEEAYKAALKKRFFALFMEQRTGKTVVALAVIVTRYNKGKINTILVICPKIGKIAWRVLSKKHLKKPIAIDTMNFEYAWRHEKEILKEKYDMIIIDESHRLKGRNTQQSKIIYRIGRSSRYRMIMTGTPTPNDLTDMWAQFRFLAPHIFGDRWPYFVDRWCKSTGFGGYKKVIKKHLEQKFLDIVSKYSFTATQKEVIKDLPKDLDIPLYFELSKKTRKIYDELEGEFVYEEGEKSVTTLLAITNMIRLHQLTGGNLQFDQDDDITHVSNEKLDTIDDFLLDRPKSKPIVIFCKFIPEAEQLTSLLTKRGWRVGKLYGKSDTYREWRKFNNGGYNAIICQIAKGISIDLSRADDAIFCSKSFSYVEYDQARKRLVGEHKKKSLGFYHVTGENTIDEYIDNAIEKKVNIADYVREQLMKRNKIMAKKKKTEDTDSKYNVAWLAEELGLSDFTIRQKLRKAGIEKTGRTYSWSNRKEALKVLRDIKDVKVGNEEKETKAKKSKKTSVKGKKKGKKSS